MAKDDLRKAFVQADWDVDWSPASSRTGCRNDLTGKEIDATYNHPFWVTDHRRFEWPVSWAGEHLSLDDGPSVTIRRVAKFDDMTTVYNLSVQNVHTFFVGQQLVLAQNSCDDLAEHLADLGKARSEGDQTAAGRAFQKHGDRQGSIYPRINNAAERDVVGQAIIERFIRDPAGSMIGRITSDYGQVIDAWAAAGGARFGFYPGGEFQFMGCLEP